LIAATVMISGGSTSLGQSEPGQASSVQQENGNTSSPADVGSLAAKDVEWIASTTGWKEFPVPLIKRTSEQEMSKLFFGFSEGINGVRPLALYAKEQHVLYLARDIDLNTLLGRSILVHELVQHLQNMNDVHFECPEAAEAQAYQLQGEWLHEHGIKDISTVTGFSETQLSGLGCL
jgi:Domain of unknown function (DUF6647)